MGWQSWGESHFFWWRGGWRWTCSRRYKRFENWKEFREACSFCENEWTCVSCVRSHISTSSLLIISNCVCGDRPTSQWSSRQPGLLPRSTHTHPVSTDWIKEEHQAASISPGIIWHKWMTTEYVKQQAQGSSRWTKGPIKKPCRWSFPYVAHFFSMMKKDICRVGTSDCDMVGLDHLRGTV